MSDMPSIDSIFCSAIEIESPDECVAFVERACGQDADLKQQVERLLHAHFHGRSILDAPVQPGATIDEPMTEAPGTLIGPYKLLEQIGEGGFGVVFMAEQQQPLRRKVALKVLKPGMDTRQVVARFELERQALALMDHPHIAKVLDGGETAAGRPFFVMDLVKGVPITHYCDQNQLTARERLELFVQVCQAVQHAHQKGIIHRDVKPSNVLVSRHDGTPVVKVIDFGIAKALGQQLTDKTLFTHFAQLVGTPLYMSPEQAGMSDLDVDTRSDIYSLGVLLYELLTGTTPFEQERLQGVGFDELRRIIREEEPPKPSTRISTLGQAATTVGANRKSDPRQLSRLFRGELDWIVMKALEKDRNRRYESASALAADVHRYLADEPVQACPPSACYRFRKFVRRKKNGLAVAGLVLLFIISLVGGVGWVVLDRAARQARAANDQELALERAKLLQEQGKRAEALAALARVELLAGLAPPDPARDARRAALKERLDAEARDQEFVARFEEVRLRVEGGVDLRASQFVDEAAFPEIRDALRRYGIEIGVLAPAEAAAGVQGRPAPIRQDLVAALDECLRLTNMYGGDNKAGASRVRARKAGDVRARQWLLAALDAADHDAWRVRARKAVYGSDNKALEQLASEADVQKQPPSFLLVVALAAPMRSTRLELLRRIQRAYPADLWANHHLASELSTNDRPAEAIRYYTAALALRPDNPGIYLNRGHALSAAGELDAAIADYRQALVLAPRYAMAHNNLGSVLRKKGKLDEAVAEYRKAIDLDPKLAMAHYNLGCALRERGKQDEAVAEFYQAIKLDPKLAKAHLDLGRALYKQEKLDEAVAEYLKALDLDPKLAPAAHYNLGCALGRQGKPDEAVAEYRKALELDPNLAEAHCNLGLVLRQQARFRQALEELRRGHELGSKNPRWRYPSAEWVRQCERLVELDGKLPGFLDRKATPASPAERIELARLCSLKCLHRAAARFYEDAFAAQPKLADDLGATHRYNAACAAALAAAGQGNDAGKLDDQGRARLRRQALAWLRADLTAWGRLLDNAPGEAPRTAGVLRHWLEDTDLAGVRGPEAPAKLPEAERQPWQKLWLDVADMLTQAQGKTAPEKK